MADAELGQGQQRGEAHPAGVVNLHPEIVRRDVRKRGGDEPADLRRRRVPGGVGEDPAVDADIQQAAEQRLKIVPGPRGTGRAAPGEDEVGIEHDAAADGEYRHPLEYGEGRPGRLADVGTGETFVRG
jgi:hypothetical protein